MHIVELPAELLASLTAAPAPSLIRRPRRQSRFEYVRQPKPRKVKPRRRKQPKMCVPAHKRSRRRHPMSKLTQKQRAQMVHRLAAGEPTVDVAAAFGVSEQHARALALGCGVVYGRKFRTRQMRSDAVDRFLLTDRGRAVAAYGEFVEPIYCVTPRKLRDPVVVRRKRDDARVIVYAPKAVARCRPDIGSPRYRTPVAAGVVAIVALPDGEALALQPLANAWFIAVPEMPEHRSLWRSRAVSFRWR